MNIIIDAYNVLKKQDGKSYISGQVRDAFVSLIRRYANKRGHSVQLVFDGGISHWPIERKNGKFSVVYSGTGQTADDYIKDYVKKIHNMDNFLLVSSDYALCSWVSDRGVVSIDSSEFHSIVEERLGKVTGKSKKKGSGTLVKTSLENNKWIDHLMIVHTELTNKKDETGYENEPFARKKADRIDSKKNKKIMNLLRRL